MTQPTQNTSIEQPTPKNKATVLDSILSGSVAGATEVVVNHPLWTVKTRIQRGESLTFNPQILYRGILPNAASMVPITAMQVGLNRLVQTIFFNNSSEMSNYQKIASGFIAGVGSSFASCPTEMVMTHQGKKGGNFIASKNYLVLQGGYKCLFSGLPATMIREGLFTSFFLAGTPIVKTKLKPYCSNDYLASLLAGMGAGLCATAATQGVDTIKTIQQSAAPQNPVGFVEAAKKLYSSHGINGFFKGAVPRGTRVVSAITIMSWVNEKMEAKFAKSSTGSDKYSIQIKKN